MRFVGDDNHRVVAHLFQTGINGVQFVGGVDDRRLEYVNGSFRHAEEAKKFKVAHFFAGVLFETATVDRVRQPDLRGVAAAVQLSCFQRALRIAAGQNGNRVRSVNRILPHQPVAKNRKAEVHQRNRDQQNRQQKRKELFEARGNFFSWS